MCVRRAEGGGRRSSVRVEPCCPPGGRGRAVALPCPCRRGRVGGVWVACGCCVRVLCVHCGSCVRVRVGRVYVWVVCTCCVRVGMCASVSAARKTAALMGGHTAGRHSPCVPTQISTTHIE
eukprot:2651312-Prymnesium_polylepis.1